MILPSLHGLSGGNDSFTELLLHMDGANGSTTFTDSSKNAFTVTAVGAAQLTTSQQKFGASSGSFNGSVGTYCTVPNSSSWDMGSGDFTCDFWFRIGATGDFETFLSRLGGGGNFVIRRDSTNVLRAFYNGGGANNGELVGVTAISANTWYHCAYVKGGSTAYLFLNGALEASGSASNSMTSAGTALYIGGRSDSSDPYAGQFDEIRITKAKARWTAAFTPPQGPYW